MYSKNATLIKQLFLLVALLVSISSSAQTHPVSVTIDATKTGAPISQYVYGQFLEHLGGIVNNNLWAEMLDDRKFYFPITSHPPSEPAGRVGDARHGARMIFELRPPYELDCRRYCAH